MTTTVTRTGRGSVIDQDRGYGATVRKLQRVSAHWIDAGLFSDSNNAYGERIATYAWVQSSPKGARPGWIPKVWKRAVEECQKISPMLPQAAISGSPSMTAATDIMAARIAAGMGRMVQDIGLVESGALARWMGNFETPTRQHERTPSPTRYRITRAGGFGDLSADQQLYNLYHGGRSRSMRLMRQATTWKQFKTTHGPNWSQHSSGERAIARKAVRGAAAYAAKVMKANYAPGAKTQGAYNASRSAFLGSLLQLGPQARSAVDARRTGAAARAADKGEAVAIRSSMAASRARSRATERDRNLAYASSIRKSLSGRRGRR
jgi:hypothetical protein